MKKDLQEMIRCFLLGSVWALIIACGGSDEPVPDPEPEPKPEEEMGWVLDFEDQFNGPELDLNVWSRIPRGNPDWANTQADFDDRCFEFRNGTLVLKGIANNPAVGDQTAYHTGGIWSKGKKSFAPGKFEICVRMKNCKGAWPAIWLMPYNQSLAWPLEGEIDIMETLNFDKFAYQTVHSDYTYNKKQTSNPKNSGTYAIKANDWNVFGVEIHKDKLAFSVNGTETLVYPKIETSLADQFPFYIPQELRIDQQLGGSWVGAVDPSGLPIEMEVDWVKHYVWKVKENR